MEKLLPRKFYQRPTQEVARDLLGSKLVHRTEKEVVSGIVVETEAYLGRNDAGSHASTRRTPRNSVMFGKAAIAYVYFTYGMHYCFNAVAKPPGEAGAVLIRALEPVKGIDKMMERRRRSELEELTSGPAKLTQALDIDKRHNGLDLTDEVLFFTSGRGEPRRIEVSKRIGLSKGKELPLRFYIPENPHLSGR